jgi:hypothetical protein
MPDYHILIVHDTAKLGQGLVPREILLVRGSSEEEGICKVLIRQAISKAQLET